MNSATENPYSGRELSFGRYCVEGDNADGEGVVVYVMDSGYNPSPESTKMFYPGKVEFPQQVRETNPPQPKKPEPKKPEPKKPEPKKPEPKKPGLNQGSPRFKVVGQPVKSEVLDQSTGQHGPRVAALIGASSVGVAPRCRVAPLRVSRENSTDIIDIATCTKNCVTVLEYHKKTHPKKPAVVNFSLSFTYKAVYSRLQYDLLPEDLLEDKATLLISDFERAIKKLIENGMIIVASGGNENQSTNIPWIQWAANGGKLLTQDDSFRAPQCFDNVIAVGGLDRDGKVWQHSGTGKLVPYYVLADEIPHPFKQDKIAGTSFASAFLSGIIACILSSDYYKTRSWKGIPDIHKRIELVMEYISSPLVVNGNPGRAFLNGKLKLPMTVTQQATAHERAKIAQRAKL